MLLNVSDGVTEAQRGERGPHRTPQDRGRNLAPDYCAYIYSSASLHQLNSARGEQSALPGVEESTANEIDTAHTRVELSPTLNINNQTVRHYLPF